MTVYQERLSPSPWLYVALLIAIPSITVLFSAFGLFWLGIIVAVLVYLAVCGAFYFLSPSIRIDHEWFSADQASIERKFLGTTEVFYDEAAFRERGRNLDLKSFYVIRAGINPVIKISNTDPDDPVPYWLISTRHPEKIVEILARTP